jgi:hypothetical protein
MNSSRRVTVAALVVTTVLSGAWPVARSRADPVTEPAGSGTAATVPAVWLGHEASFVYMGQTTYYTCHGLRDKVRYILEQVGARRDDLKVLVSCTATGVGVETMPRVQIKATLPAAATPELLQQLRDDPKRELVARVRGEGSPDLATEQFPAVRKVVQFDGTRASRVEDGDCELLESLVARVFPELGVGVVEGSRLQCVRHALPIGSVMLRLESLHAAPRPDTAPKSP